MVIGGSCSTLRRNWLTAAVACMGFPWREEPITEVLAAVGSEILDLRGSSSSFDLARGLSVLIPVKLLSLLVVCLYDFWRSRMPGFWPSVRYAYWAC